MLMRALLAVCLCQVLQSVSGYHVWWNPKSSVPDALYHFPENPTSTDLLSEVNMDTPIVKFHNWLEATYFGKRIEEVIPGRVYHVVGYTLGYPSLIVGDNGNLIMIDSPESYPQAQLMLADLRQYAAVGNKSIEAVVITLFHGDHIWGLKAFLEDVHNNGVTPAVYMHSEWLSNVQVFDTYKTFKLPRIFRSFGLFIPNKWHLHDGAASRIIIQPVAPGPFVPTFLSFPTEDSVLKYTIAGSAVEFHSIPGYTTDSIVTCFPALSLCHAADVFYVTFANIYTLRGEPARDARKWAMDAKKVANIQMDFFVATHTWPIIGAANIRKTLMDFSDGILLVHDQTLRWMYKGFPSDVIATKVHLPKEQAEKTFLVETYGLVETSVRSIVDFYVGWFSGFAEDMFPLNRVDRTNNMITLVSEKKIYAEAVRAYDNEEFRWAMEMISHLYNNDPTVRLYKELRALCMIRQAEGTPSVLSRHYLLSQVLEMYSLLPAVVKINTRPSLGTLHLDGVFQNLQSHADAQRLEAEVSGSLELYLNLTDGNTYLFTFRNCILDYDQVSAPAANVLTFTTTTQQFRDFLVSTAALDSAAYGTASSGTAAGVNHFFGYLDFQDEA